MEEKRENETAEDGAASAPARGGRIDRYLGAYPAFKGRKEIDAWISEMRDDEDRVPDE